MNEFNYDIISQYLAGELVGDELLAFEKQLQNNTALANEVALYKTIDSELYLLQKNKTETENLTNTLKSLGQAHFKKNEAKVVSINKRWWYAASAVAAAVILFFVFNPTKTAPFNNETLYASYVNKSIDELSVQQRGDNDSLLTKASSFYNKKEYDAALPLLQKVIENNSNDTQLQLAVGVCYMQTNEYDLALKTVDTISLGNTVFKNKAQWYKALIFLKQNKLAECKIALQAIPNNADDYINGVELVKQIGGN